MNTNPYMRLVSGRRFYYLDPKPNQVSLEDIVHSLSRLPRYNGHTEVPLYVLQHLCMCYDIAPDDVKREALAHDFAESLTGDAVSPLKILMPQFKEIEDRIERMLARKFKLVYPYPALVKEIDLTILATEMRDLMPKWGDWKRLPYKPIPERIIPWDSAKCRREFMRRYRKLYP